MYDLLVVGGGPAGIAAAVYGLHLGLQVRLIAPDLGGKITYQFTLRDTERLKSVYGAELVYELASQVDEGTHISDSVTAIEALSGGFLVRTAANREFAGRALVLAMGAKPRRLFIPGEEKYWGKGLSYSAISHARFFVDRDVAVVGNDWRAQVAALELARGSRLVQFVNPQPRNLDPELMERITAMGNVQQFKGWEPISVDGNTFLTGLSLQNNKGLVRELKLDGVFITLGLIPNSDVVAHLVERDADGRIKVNQQAATSRPGIFAAGDITDVHGEQVPVALGEGIKAALSASEYLVRRLALVSTPAT